MIRIATALLFAASVASADEFKVEPLKEAPPAAVAGALKSALAKTGTRVVDAGGKPYMDFWLRTALPAIASAGELGVEYGTVAKGGFVGVVRVHAKGSDFRGHAFPAGTYTMRYAWRPQDGDHQGTSETRDFILLSHLTDDTALAPVDEKHLHERSARVSSKKHPAVLYLVKWYEEGKAPRVFMNDENEHWFFECAIPSAKGAAPFRLWIVIRGMAPEF